MESPNRWRGIPGVLSKIGLARPYSRPDRSTLGIRVIEERLRRDLAAEESSMDFFRSDKLSGVLIEIERGDVEIKIFVFNLRAGIHRERQTRRIPLRVVGGEIDLAVIGVENAVVNAA